jgi:heme-degrading monooxygenase HmoA
MILEHAVLDVRVGEERDFEAAFREAVELIATADGFVALRLERCLETPNRYLLLVEWQSLGDHVEGFRKAADYARWAALLHRFYEPFPIVEHYESVVRA